MASDIKQLLCKCRNTNIQPECMWKEDYYF